MQFEMQYFTVTRALKFGGRRYIPCVQYKVTPVNVETVAVLVKEGWAKGWDKEVFFCNGVAIDPKEAQKKPEPIPEAKIVEIVEKKDKKRRREF